MPSEEFVAPEDARSVLSIRRLGIVYLFLGYLIRTSKIHLGFDRTSYGTRNRSALQDVLALFGGSPSRARKKNIYSSSRQTFKKI